MDTHLIFTSLRNEGPFLLEWVAYHRWLGFDRFVLFTNDCADGTDAMADRLAALGLAQHIRNEPDPKRGPQWTALRSAELRKALRTADWAAHLDVDEYLNLPGSFDQLLDRVGDADAISLPWRFFGNADVSTFQDAPVVTQFTRCGPYPFMYPRQGMMFKTLFRPGAKFKRPGIHAPRPSDGAQPRWLNGNGRPVSKGFNPKRPLLVGPDAGNALGQVNHYALRSRESFLVKSERGLPNHRDVPIDLAYWCARNFNSETDTRLADRWPGAAEKFDELMADIDLARLHAQACNWHRDRAAALMRTRAGIELYASTVVAGDTRPAPEHELARIYDGMRAVYGKAKARA